MYNLKFSISSKQSKEYLDKADEMFVLWKDHELIYDLYHLSPKTIILRIPLGPPELFKEDWEKIIEYHQALGSDFKLALKHPRHGIIAKDNGIPFFFEYPVNDFPTVNQYIKQFGVSEIIPGAVLSHNMSALEAKGVPIRMIVNRHCMPTWDKERFPTDGTVGAWVRPEDLWKTYAKYIKYVQFNIPDDPTKNELIREQALFRIYAEQKTWSGDIKMLIDDLNHDGVNRLIVDDFGERRANCRQMCEVNSNCHFCYRALDLANPTLLKRVTQTQD